MFACSLKCFTFAMFICYIETGVCVFSIKTHTLKEAQHIYISIYLVNVDSVVYARKVGRDLRQYEFLIDII